MSSCLDSALYFQFISTLVAIVMMQVSAQCQVISTTSEIRKNSGCIKQMQPLLTSTKASHCGYEQGGIAVFYKPLPRHYWAVTSQTTKNTESKADKTDLRNSNLNPISILTNGTSFVQNQIWVRCKWLNMWFQNLSVQSLNDQRHWALF